MNSEGLTPYRFIACIIVIILSASCSRHNEPAPFFDGLYLKYSETFSNANNPEDNIWSRAIEYTFSQDENGNFPVSQNVITQRGDSLNKNIDPVPFPEVQKNLTLDRYGIVLQGGDFINFINNEASYLWLPADKRKTGKQVIVFLRKVAGKQQWGKWQVISVKGMLGEIYYYDENTGLLVGSESVQGKLKMMLKGTNRTELNNSLH